MEVHTPTRPARAHSSSVSVSGSIRQIWLPEDPSFKPLGGERNPQVRGGWVVNSEIEPSTEILNSQLPVCPSSDHNREGATLMCGLHLAEVSIEPFKAFLYFRLSGRNMARVECYVALIRTRHTQETKQRILR